MDSLVHARCPSSMGEELRFHSQTRVLNPGSAINQGGLVLYLPVSGAGGAPVYAKE